MRRLTPMYYAPKDTWVVTENESLELDSITGIQIVLFLDINEKVIDFGSEHETLAFLRNTPLPFSLYVTEAEWRTHA